MADPPVTLSHLVAHGAELLRRAGLAEPRREALRIWSELAGEAPGRAALDPARPVPAGLADAVRAALSRRAAGEPLAYITGVAGFRHLTVAVDRRVLIPRPETEGLVELVLERSPAGRVADIGTGSGCIALSLSSEGSYTAVVGVDRSAEALVVAARNAGRTGLPVRLVRGDLTAPLAAASLDALVSNPPYLTEAEYRALDRSVRDWEPESALASGPGGLDATDRLLDDGRRVLRRGGWLAIEVDAARAGEVAERALALGWAGVEVRPDLYGRERFLLAQRSQTS